MTEKANNCCFAFILFVIVTVGVVLQFICALNFSINDSFCDFNMSSNVTEFEEDRAAVSTFRVLAWIAFATELIAFVLVSARIKCCAKMFCVPCCHETWISVNGCGNGWFVFSMISAVLNMAGMIEFRIFSTSCVISILAFHYVIANFIIGTIKVLCYIVFLCKYGCPDTRKFLGSNNEIADYEIHQTVTEHTEPDGRVWTSKSSKLVRK